MSLSSEQLDAIRLGQPVRIDLPEVGADCVVVRADVFACRGRLDDGLTMEQVAALVNAGMREDDMNDPLLAGYQHYRR